MRIGIGWRLVVVLALLLYVGMVVVAASIVVQNVILSLLAVPTVAALAYAGWLVFTGVGKRKWQGIWLLCAAAVLLLVQIAAFVRDRANMRSLLLLGVFTFLYTATVLALRRYYWRQMRLAGSGGGRVARFKHPYLIINPKSGNGRAVKAGIESIARERGITCMVTRPGDDVGSLAMEAALQGADVLGISGGDGSIGAVAKVALELDLPVVVLPGGTRCHFARDIGLDPKRIGDALAGFDGVERRVDVGSINGRIFLNNASFGLYADIVDNPDYRGHKVRVSRNLLQSIMGGTRPAYGLRFRHGSRTFRSAVVVLVSVNKYETYSLLDLGRRQELDGGVLQVTAITKLDDAMVRRLASSLPIRWQRQRQTGSNWQQWETAIFKISNTESGSGGKIVVGVDGEREEYTSPVFIQVRPEALKVYVPAEGVRSRPYRAYSGTVIRRLAQALTGKVTA